MGGQMSWKCLVCDENNGDDWERCVLCHRLKGTWRCVSCGRLNRAKDMSCRACGMEKYTTSPPDVPQPHVRAVP